jgi:branched-chain amino acid transport system substrate-binding protein
MRIVVVFLILGSAGGCGTAPAPPPIYVGHVAVTSGPERAAGEEEALGIRLAIEELARAGHDKLAGRPVHVKHADAHGQPDAFESQAVRLVTVSKAVALIGGNSPEEVLRLDRARVPLVTPLGARPRGTGDLVFAVGIAPAAQARALARFAVQDKGVTTTALVVDERRQAYRELAETFESEMRQALQSIRPNEEVKKSTTFRFGKDAKLAELAKRVGGAKVQGVLFAGPAQDYEEWRAALPNPEFLIFFAGAETALHENRTDPAYVASPFAVDPDLPKTVEFARRFREAFKKEPDVHAALAYEGIRILADAMNRAQAPAGDKFLEELRATKDFPGLAGPLTFGTDQQLRRPVFVGRSLGNLFTPSKRFEP